MFQNCFINLIYQKTTTKTNIMNIKQATWLTIGILTISWGTFLYYLIFKN